MQQAGPVLAMVASVAVLSSVAIVAFGAEPYATPTAGAVFAIVASGLPLVARGHAWARWLLCAGFAASGLCAVVAGLMMLLFDLSTPQETLSYFQTGVTISVGASFSGAAAALFASDALDELCAPRRSSRLAGAWEAVNAGPSTRRVLPTPASTDEAQVLGRQRRGMMTGQLSAAAAALAWISFAIAAVVFWREGLDALPAAELRQSGSFAGVFAVFVYLSLVYGYAGYLVAAYLAFFMTALFVVLPFALPLAVRWRAPARFLILRPFNRSNASRALRAILLRELSALGHCYTLADADVRIPLWLRLPLVFGQLSFFVFRRRKIVVPGDLTKLVHAMDRRVLRNVNWCLTRDKLFPLACVDAGWRACVTRLVVECDCVVMDLSGLSGNILWELELLKRSRALERSVFLVEAEQLAEAQAALNRLVDASPQLLTYDAHGLVPPCGLGAAARRALAASRHVRN